MPSPYVAQEAARLKIMARNLPPPARPIPKLIVSAKAEYRTGDYRFARCQTDPAPLEKSRPLESGAARLLRMFTIAFIFASAWATTAGLAWLLTRQ